MIFGFIHGKSMANFRKGTWKLRENTLLVVKLLPTLISTAKKKFHVDYECSLPESDAQASSFFSFFFSRGTAVVFSRAFAFSCKLGVCNTAN